MNKGSIWPSPEDEARGLCFIDPCTAQGDHAVNWTFLDTGEIQALTLSGEYTEDKLLLWRPILVYRRRQQYRDQREVADVRKMLEDKDMDADHRDLLLTRLADIEERVSPPVFDRAPRIQIDKE